MEQGVWWRRFNGALIPFVLLLWAAAMWTGWINSVAFLAHISMGALVLAAVGAYRADKPTPPE